MTFCSEHLEGHEAWCHIWLQIFPEVLWYHNYHDIKTVISKFKNQHFDITLWYNSGYNITYMQIWFHKLRLWHHKTVKKKLKLCMTLWHHRLQPWNSFVILWYWAISCLGKTITWVWTVIDPYEIILKCFELIAEIIAKFIISLLNFTHLFAQWCCLLLLAVLQQLLSWSPTPRTGLCKSIWLSQHLIYGNMAVQASIILAFAWRSLNL